MCPYVSVCRLLNATVRTAGLGAVSSLTHAMQETQETQGFTQGLRKQRKA